ncbi:MULTISPECIES: hypothetical protein [unclassified Streptomyces]|uniref:hypothetical protein n=1 Tax=unclassified Streptomyces TaxID=2593676 RepID=UPI003449B228
MTTVVEQTPEQLREWKARLLGKVRLSEEELAERAENYQLTEAELTVWNTLQGIEYLSGGDV